MKNISAKARLVRALQLQKQIESLPQKYIESDKEYYYGTKSEAEKEESNRLLKIKKALRYDLGLELQSFIKVAYGTDNEYYERLSQILLLTEEKGFITTSIDSMNQQWNQGRHSLVWFMKNLIAEEQERSKIDKLMEDKTLPFRYAGFGVTFMIGILAIWLAPVEMLSRVFKSEGIFAVRVLFSIGLTLPLMTILKRELWKEFVLPGIIAVATAMFTFLKTDNPHTEKPNKSNIETLGTQNVKDR